MQNANLYRLMTWLSPSFPVGAYAYSHGLESAVDARLVLDSHSLLCWVKSIVQDGSGRVDAILFCAAFRAINDGDQQTRTLRLWEIVEMSAAMRGTSELADESKALGRAFLRTVRVAWPSTELELLIAGLEQEMITYPVAVAIVCAVSEISIENAITAYLHAFASNLVSVGVRLIPLGQSEGQKVLADLEEVALVAALAAQQCFIEDVGSATPLVDWTSMRHETQYTRLYRS